MNRTAGVGSCWEGGQDRGARRVASTEVNLQAHSTIDHEAHPASAQHNMVQQLVALLLNETSQRPPCRQRGQDDVQIDFILNYESQPAGKEDIKIKITS
eukprot:1162034-Pelagomonas_calceolata.AAC.10